MGRLLGSLIALVWAGAASAQPVHVFAAASLHNALDDVVSAYQATAPDADIRLTFAGSSTLARQIAAGAPADIFMSANTQWVELLDTEGRLIPGTHHVLLQNRLALVASTAGDDLDVTRSAAWHDALGTGRIAVALVDAVPAGIYAKQALIALDQWDTLSPRLAQTDNVRAALNLVARGETPLGIVYTTDAKAEPRVFVRAIFPEHTHQPIDYPVALIEGAGKPSDDARRFFEFLRSNIGAQIFTSHGFRTDLASR